MEINALKDKLKETLPKNAGGHNSVFRGKNITDLFYSGVLSQQIAAGTFDDIFVGDYIVGKNSGTIYIVGDLDYRYLCGDTPCETHHMLMFPFAKMGTANMNDTNVTTGAYYNSKMKTTNLAAATTTITNDFGSAHLLKHREVFANAVTNGYETNGAWYDSTVDLMNERMVYGNKIFNNCINGTNWAYSYTIDKSQLAVFRLRPDYIICRSTNSITAKDRYWWWLRDVASGSPFCGVGSDGNSAHGNASYVGAVRPAFLIY